MFGDKSKNIFWIMIKNQKENKNKLESNLPIQPIKEKKYSVFLENQSDKLGNKGDLMKIIEKLPTFKKISLLQGLLKEMKSIKERFEDNKNDMLTKISKNCYNYYRSKIGMKKIYDYCKSENPEINLDYILLENTQELLSKN